MSAPKTVAPASAADVAGGSGTAGSPNADIVAELRRFLELGAAQLDAAIREADASVDKLAAAITSVASEARELGQQVLALETADAAKAVQLRSRIGRLTEALNAHVQASITALQFYDKLIQRLTHVREGLAIPSDSAGTVNPGASDWGALLEQVRSRYSMVEERVLFDFMMRGLNAEQMLKALTGLRSSAASGEFEAF